MLADGKYFPFDKEKIPAKLTRLLSINAYGHQIIKLIQKVKGNIHTILVFGIKLAIFQKHNQCSLPICFGKR